MTLMSSNASHLYMFLMIQNVFSKYEQGFSVDKSIAHVVIVHNIFIFKNEQYTN